MLDLDVRLEIIYKKDYDWAKLKEYAIVLDDFVIGNIALWSFNKESILENIEEDFAYYMDEDTHMNEKTANFILNNIGNRECIYIDSIIINENYRNNGFGTKAINIIKEKFKNSFLVLLASALDVKDKILFIDNDSEAIDDLLSKLNYFYKKLGFKNKKHIYYIN